jgi:hypothetical protein
MKMKACEIDPLNWKKITQGLLLWQCASCIVMPLTYSTSINGVVVTWVVAIHMSYRPARSSILR